jgi:hypothetical protein
MSDIKDIFKQQDPLDPKLLQHYFEGTLDDATQHQVEAALADDDPFTNDAVEGLQQQQGNLSLTLYDIEKKISNRIKEKARIKHRKPFLSQQQIIVMVAVILLLILAAYGIIHLLRAKQG